MQAQCLHVQFFSLVRTCEGRSTGAPSASTKNEVMCNLLERSVERDAGDIKFEMHILFLPRRCDIFDSYYTERLYSAVSHVQNSSSGQAES